MAYVRSLLQLELPRDFVQLYISHYWIFVFDLCLTVNLILEENRRIWFDLILNIVYIANIYNALAIEISELEGGRFIVS